MGCGTPFAEADAVPSPEETIREESLLSMRNKTVSLANRGRIACRALSAAARAAAPTVIAALVVIAVVALVADAQQVSSKPIEEVALNWRNWLITKIVPTAGAAVLSWNALETKTGHREGFGKLTRGFVSLLIGLGAAGVVSSAASLVQ